MIYHVFAASALGLLIVNGLRVVIGVPPVSYWFRSRRCPLCDGVGYLRAHTHTGEIVEIPMKSVIEASRPLSGEAVQAHKERD